MKKVIITGADGFVGSYAVECFLKNGCQVLAADLAEKPSRLKPHENLLYRQCDISTPEGLKALDCGETFDIMIHFAWNGSAGEKRADYAVQIQNVCVTVECMKYAQKLGCTRFAAAGSIMEYEAEAAVHSQGSRPGMGYIYGYAKQNAHCICKSAANQVGIELVWPMITNAYGVGEFSPRFINSTIRKIIKKEPLQFTAATQNYDFVYVSDVARAFYLTAMFGKANCEYMIGSGQARPLKEFILEMQRVLAPEQQVLFGDIPFTGTNLPLSVYDISAIRADCGFTPEVSFEDGLRRTMTWISEREASNGTEI